MRSRSNSGVRLDYFQHLLSKTILNNQDPVTGLLRSQIPGCLEHAWVRDNVYAVHSIWGLALAYRKQADFDEDRAKAYELEQICVKVMRSLLMCMMRQLDKVEKFKKSQSTTDSLHAKYSARILQAVVSDTGWGHLQIDATSLYLLTLAQMTASGLQIVYNLDEVGFVQNLVFYIETAYRIPDYGVWERGDKTNHGLAELNASSIGMAKSALQALNDLDLFGAHGSPASVIHVLADEMQQCQAVLESMLPRESNSKECDAYLLAVVSYPAFAIEDSELIKLTRDTIVNKLQGRYGCRRFLRDGYKTAREDANRLYYEPWELQKFENIECEWPLFFCYLILDGLFTGDKEQVTHYRSMLEKILVRMPDGLKVVPELYTVPIEKVDLESENPGSQDRVPGGGGGICYMWAQSLYILGCLIEEGFIQGAELDPLNLRLSTEKRPETVIQVVVLAEDKGVQEKLAAHGVKVETVGNIDPFIIQPASVLGNMYAQLGKYEKMGLTGRPSHYVGLLSTSKLYMIDDRIFCFSPQFLDWERFYWTHDINILLDILKSELAYLKSSWNVSGRPLFAMVISNAMLKGSQRHSRNTPTGVIGTLKKFKSGYLGGSRVIMGNIQDFLTTSCITHLTFLGSHHRMNTPQEVDTEVREYLESVLGHVSPGGTRYRLPSCLTGRELGRRMSIDHKQRVSTIKGLAQRHKSIMVAGDDEDLAKLRLKYGGLQSQASVSPSTNMFASGYTSPLEGLMSPAVTLSGPQSIHESQTGSSPAESPPQSPVLAHFLTDFHGINHSRSEMSLQQLNCEELVETLMETDNLEEQADIVHYLWTHKGADWDTNLMGKKGTPVRKLVEELYEKACHSQMWWLVRHTAGLLDKKVEDLAKAVTDLLVRQKQVTVGMPAIHEEAIARPLPPEELQKLIKGVFGDDTSSAMLTTELLVYLGMFVRTEPKLFTEMLRLRVGLIIQVMASELARALQCGGEEASQHLLNLSPYEMKTLLHHILSGKEFGGSNFAASNTKSAEIQRFLRSKSFATTQGSMIDDSRSEYEGDTSDDGQWLRRRRIDGALNRVPSDFYGKIWRILRKCEGLNIHGWVLHSNLTKEMTREEIKFALTVESILNRIPEPEYRQLMVEALMVLTMLAENQTNLMLGPGIVTVHDIVHEANRFFIDDQRREQGEARHCCAGDPPINCGGVNNICHHFYDSAPSGRYGTLSYMCRAVACKLKHPGDDIECIVS